MALAASLNLKKTPSSGAFDVGEEEERWHVAFSPSDLRVLTVEQLDSAYRLNLVNNSTKVWKKGMAEWLPLGVVAGLEPEPPRTAQLAPTPAAAPVAKVPARTEPVRAPTPPSQPAQSTTADPPAEVPRVEAARAAPPPPSARRAGARETILSVELEYLKRTSRQPVFWLYVVLSLAGLACVAFRNDALRRAAPALGLARTYESLEQSVTGPPGFGTLRNVNLLLDKTEARIPDVRAERAARAQAAPAPSSP